MRRVAALLALATLGAAPKYGPVPNSPQTAVVKQYVADLQNGNFAAAFALLSDDERRYFGDVAGYRSVFDADGFALQRAQVVGARGDDRGRVFFVRERIAYVNHASDLRRVVDATVPLGVLREHGTLHVKDPGKPYYSFTSSSTAATSALRVTVKKADFFPDRIALIVTFANLGDSLVTVLPYGKSVLRDEQGNVYRVVAVKNWTVTDKQLYEGIPLAPSAQYTGSMSFAAPRLDPHAHVLSLTVAPALRAGGDAPFELTVPVARAR
ncbi:MAG TPA: hypothetical protein VGN14_15985 [Candidatus Elarobacter sp.]